jgi:hypothetical protein
LGTFNRRKEGKEAEEEEGVEEEKKEEEEELKEEQSTSKSLLECVKDNDVANLTRQVSAFSYGVRRNQLVSAPPWVLVKFF